MGVAAVAFLLITISVVWFVSPFLKVFRETVFHFYLDTGNAFSISEGTLCGVGFASRHLSFKRLLQNTSRSDPENKAVGGRAMAAYTIKLKERKEIAEGTAAFYFEKPPDFQFKAGQYLVVSLIDPSETDSEGNDRTFSIASAPFENRLMVATRMRDTAFKRVLRALPIEAEVNMRGPFGSFILHNDPSRPAVFLVGGIGITPVRSIVLQAIRDKLLQPLYLFYSNRRPEDAAFLEELQRAGTGNINYKFVGTMTDMAKSHRSWCGETSFVSREMIARYVKDVSEPVYYVVGPPAMVMAMRKLLSQARMDDDNICTEEFAGY